MGFCSTKLIINIIIIIIIIAEKLRLYCFEPACRKN